MQTNREDNGPGWYFIVIHHGLHSYDKISIVSIRSNDNNCTMGGIWYVRLPCNGNQLTCRLFPENKHLKYVFEKYVLGLNNL